MNREDLLRVGLVLFGAWLAVRGISALSLYALDHDEWVTHTYILTHFLLNLGLGALFLLGSGRVARRVLPAESSGAPAGAASLADLKTVAVALLGLFLLAGALPGILEQGLAALHNPWSSYDHPVWSIVGSLRMSDLIQAAIGLALFFGSAPIGRFWARLRQPDFRAPTAEEK